MTGSRTSSPRQGKSPPHLIEQSMLLSVVYAGRTESDTAEIYEQICSAVIERRKSKNRP